MKQRIIGKGLAVAVILLFLGLAIQPSVAVQPETEIDIEPKDYLFQTIIDIANNPEVKELLEQYDYDLFKVEIEKSIYRNIFFRNPRLFRSLMSNKPYVTYDSLDNLYNHGIRIIELIGEDKSLEIMESVELKNPETLEKIDDIINENYELNNNLKLYPPYQDNPVICIILEIIFTPLILARIFLLSIFSLFNNLFPLMREFFLLSLEIRLSLCLYFMTKYECIDWPPYS